MSVTARKFIQDQHHEIHGPFVPADIRDGDTIEAEVSLKSEGRKIKLNLRVWRLSPLGVELKCDSETKIGSGTPLDLKLIVGHQSTLHTGLVVSDYRPLPGENSILFIRLVTNQRERIESVERRKGMRWLSSQDFYPTAVASNPVKYNDFIFFKIRDISVGGFKLETSLRNKFIVSGMEFDCIINFPMVSQIRMRLRVQNVRIELHEGREFLSVGTSYVMGDRHAENVIGHYLLQFSNLNSLEDLRNNGLVVDQVAEAVQFSFVTSRDEYEDVLRLRFLAYSNAGKVAPGTRVEDMADKYDARSRIVIGKYKGRIISSARITFSSEEEPLEQETHVKWRSDLPRRDDAVEVMRACTHPDFRRSDLLISMLRFIAVTVSMAKKNWIVICATNDIMGFYNKIGFKDTGLSYEYKALNNRVHNVMIANVKEAMEGKSVGMITWNLVWSKAAAYLAEFGLIELDPLTNLRLKIYRFLSPTTSLFLKLNKKLKGKKMKIRNENVEVDLKKETLAESIRNQVVQHSNTGS